MEWKNIRDFPPPIAVQIVLNIGGNFYIGKLNNSGIVDVQGWTPTGLYISEVKWSPINQ